MTQGVRALQEKLIHAAKTYNARYLVHKWCLYCGFTKKYCDLCSSTTLDVVISSVSFELSHANRIICIAFIEAITILTIDFTTDLYLVGVCVKCRTAAKTI